MGEKIRIEINKAERNVSPQIHLTPSPSFFCLKLERRKTQVLKGRKGDREDILPFINESQEVSLCLLKINTYCKGYYASFFNERH